MIVDGQTCKMVARSHFDNRIISALSRVRTKGIVPLSLTALLLVTSCSSDDPTSALDTTSSAPVTISSPSTSSSTTTSSSSVPTTLAPIVASSELVSPGEGFTSLFVGHSFFDPVATKFLEHATGRFPRSHSRACGGRWRWWRPRGIVE